MHSSTPAGGAPGCRIADALVCRVRAHPHSLCAHQYTRSPTPHHTESTYRQRIGRNVYIARHAQHGDLTRENDQLVVRDVQAPNGCLRGVVGKNVLTSTTRKHTVGQRGEGRQYALHTGLSSARNSLPHVLGDPADLLGELLQLIAAQVERTQQSESTETRVEVGQLVALHAEVPE
jgi:hypothetical protein